MCIAYPGRILELRGGTAVVDFSGARKDVNCMLVEAKVGDMVLVHAGFAIRVVDDDYKDK